MDDQKKGLIESSKDGIVSAIRGAGNVGSAVIGTIGNLAGTAIKSTAEATGDLGAAAKGLVEGVIEGAKELGLDATEAASAAATGALKAAGEIGAEAGQKVRNALTGTIAGVKVVLKEPFKATERN